MFFRPKANLSDAEKSRIEFCLQQIAECVGFDRLLRPVVSRKAIFDAYEVERNPQQVVALVGEHLGHDINGIQVRVALPQAQSTGGSCCGGGSCDGPSELAGRYEPSGRCITLDQKIDSDPSMGIAALINGVVCDLLSQNNFAGAHLPEQVDLAVVGMGLGMIRSGISLVAKHPAYWDSTQWDVFPRPFLDGKSLAYANAIAAWARDDEAPKWSNDLPSDLRRPMRKSLKFLLKTNDSFFQPRDKQALLAQSQSEWWKLTGSSSTSNQVIALRHLKSDGKLDDRQASLLLDRLHSSNVAITLNAIAAIERLAFQHSPSHQPASQQPASQQPASQQPASHQPAICSESMVHELRSLTDHRDDAVRAKAMCVLAKLGGLDEATVETAVTMLETHPKHLVFAGLYALSMHDSVPEEVLPALDRCFAGVLRACDYEFIDLISAAYRRLIDDPQSHFEELFQSSPEHLPIALEALQRGAESPVPLRRGA